MRYGPACVLALAAACAPLPGPGARPSLSDLRITTQLSGWRETPGSFQRFTPQTLFDIIDGAAPEYNDRGLVEGFRQALTGPDGASAEVFVFDFGAPDSAQVMLAGKCGSAAGRLTLPDTDSASACGAAVIGGCVAYALAGKFYVEVTVSGVGDHEKALALAGHVVRHVQSAVTAGP